MSMDKRKARVIQRDLRVFHYLLNRYAPYHFGELPLTDLAMHKAANGVREYCERLAVHADDDGIDPTPFYGLVGMMDHPRDEDFDAAQSAAKYLASRAERQVGPDPIKPVIAECHQITKWADLLVGDGIEETDESRHELYQYSKMVVEAIERTPELAALREKMGDPERNQRDMLLTLARSISGQVPLDGGASWIVTSFGLITAAIAKTLVDDQPAEPQVHTAALFDSQLAKPAETSQAQPRRSRKKPGRKSSSGLTDEQVLEIFDAWQRNQQAPQESRISKEDFADQQGWTAAQFDNWIIKRARRIRSDK